MKTKIYNLIILDESGSMQCVNHATISGCNEVIQNIQATQARYADTQEHVVSIYAFQTGSVPSRYIIKNVPAKATMPISNDDYKPAGCTPLYDAIGSTISELKAIAGNNVHALASITIITDGYENSSHRYKGLMVRRLIEQVKEMGWNVNFIGANIDVATEASKLGIDNTLQFTQSNEGTEGMFCAINNSQTEYFDSMDIEESDSMSDEEIIESRKKRSKSFFTKYFN